MELELKLKHIAPYLPYGLRCQVIKNEYVPEQKGELFRIETGKTTKRSLYDPYVVINDIEIEIEYIKPILRPLSDLTKEIEHEGERFVPSSRLSWNNIELLIDNIKEEQYDEGENGSLENVGYRTIEQLLQWHFDIYGLIENGLAISYDEIESK